MKSVWLALVGLLLVAPAWGQVNAVKEDDELAQSVVKIYTVFRRPNYFQPWDTGYQESLTGSGAVIEGHRILTNAHVVSNQVFLQVRKVGDPKKYTAHVEFVGHDCELAVLKVDDPAFFEGTTPVAFGDLPYQRDKVAAYGFPVGGDDLSITEGVVSRIEVTTYTHSRRALLTIQTDAAINPGNSGGPVFKDGKLIGVSFQSYSGSRAENIGYVIPMPVIRTFFTDVADGHYDGVPSLGVYTEKMENESLRVAYHMKPDQTGVLVSRVVYDGSAAGVLQEDDVLMNVDGVAVANDRTVPLRAHARVDYVDIIGRHQIGDVVAVEVLRQGKPLCLRVPLKRLSSLVPGPRYDESPEYRIFAGLVFVPLTTNYMNAWDANRIPARFRYLQEFGVPSPEQHQVVLVSQILAHENNVGYHDVRSAVVSRVNGRRISGMSDLAAALAAPQKGYQIIELDDHRFRRPDRHRFGHRRSDDGGRTLALSDCQSAVGRGRPPPYSLSERPLALASSVSSGEPSGVK
jgi:S1-C subfamily serine protease